MTQLQKYLWLIETIRRAGKISHKELSDKWERCKDLSDCKPLHRATFNRWRDAISTDFGIIIECQRVGGYNYYISNPEDIDENELKKWMLDSFAVGNVIGENLSLKGRILVDEIPSGRDYLTTILAAMRENRIVKFVYKAFKYSRSYNITAEPLCVKLYDGRWYLLGHNLDKDTMRIYGLDRIESIEITDKEFKLPKNFLATEYFSNYFGIVTDDTCQPQRIIIRTHPNHTPYLKSLPMHHSQLLIEETDKYGLFEYYLVPTYDFEMKLLQAGELIEVISPITLRNAMMERISKMYDFYFLKRPFNASRP